MRRVLIALLVMLWAAPAGADCTGSGLTWLCSNGSTAAQINTAISSATTGATVTLAPGTYTWSEPVVISGKALKLVGAGIGLSNVTATVALQVTSTATNFVEISGFTFIKGAPDSGGIVQITGVLDEVTFRFHHCRLFDNSVAGGRGIYVYAGYGLIDNIEVEVDDSTASDQMISVNGSLSGSDGGYTPWTLPLALGTNQAVYIEDSTFRSMSAEDIIDAYQGARLVVRHNQFYEKASVGLHGTDSNYIRSPVSIEMYDNTFSNSTGVVRRATTNRGGTAVYFNNTYGGSTEWIGLRLYYYRAMYYQDDGGTWQHCDGTQYDIGSADLSATASRTTVAAGTGVRFLAAYPDTISAVGTRYFDGSGSYGYPCRDQPGRGPHQSLAPVYAWNNTGAVIVVGAADAEAPAPASNWIAENRDYYNYTASFDGTVGVGRGTLASRPSTCAPLTAYFATDQGTSGTLYQCATTNTWTSYYTPYAYPHPLQGATASAPNAPTNVRIR